MRTVDEILKDAKQLSPQERRRLREELAKLDVAEEAEGPYASLLALAGTGHTGFLDVSTSKGKHLAQTYAPKRGRKRSAHLRSPPA